MQRGRVNKKSGRRNQTGSSITEFGPVLACFVIFVLVPLLDCGVIPIRYGITYGVMNELVHRLGEFEKPSRVSKMFESDKWWLKDLNACGIGVKSIQVDLISMGQGVEGDRPLYPTGSGTTYAPNAAGGPFIYYLRLNSTVEISPLFPMSMPWAPLPGLTAPATITISADAPWENLSRDSESPTGDFFVTE